MKIEGKGKGPLILVTNDDGVYAKGIVALSKALSRLGRVVVVAPDRPQSATSHSITLHRPLRIGRISRDRYAIDGTPTDCIMLGINEILKARPDLIVSGINNSENLGDDVHYSGTVSAAFEGGVLGIPSIAVSLAVAGRNFKSAADFAVRVAQKVLAEGLPPSIILNVNVPAVITCNKKKYVFAKQGKRDWGDMIVEKVDPRGRKYYWIGGDETGFIDIPGSDCNAMKEGMVSITPLRVDLTDRAALKKLARWKL